MTKDDVVKVLMVMASEIYEKNFTSAGAAMMVQDLSEFTPDEVIAALARCRKELPKFPTVAEVVSRIPGQGIDFRSQALMIAGKIMKAVTYMGPYKVKEAREDIGEVGWGVVSMSGGWQTICQMTEKEIGIHKAQWAQLAEVLLKRGPEKPRPKEIEMDPQVKAAIRLPKMPGGEGV